MPETCTVAADDVRLVTLTMTTAFGFMSAMPGIDAVLEACARLSAAAEQSALPPSPVSSYEELAIMDRHTFDAYRDQGFDEEQSFEVLRMMIATRCNIAVAAANRG